MRPAGTQLDKLKDPADVIAKESVLWQVFDRFRELDFDSLESPDPDTTPAQAVRLRFLVNEELAGATPDSRSVSASRGFHRFFAKLSGRPELIERFCGPGSQDIGCWAVTEPDHGSDTLAFDQPHFQRRETARQLHCAQRGRGVGDSRQKAAWVSNGTIATVAALFCTIDPSLGFQGGGVAIVPLDLPGVSRGKPLDKIGQRALNQGEIFFDDVRIPRATWSWARRPTASSSSRCSRWPTRLWERSSSVSRERPSSTHSPTRTSASRVEPRSSATRA